MLEVVGFEGFAGDDVPMTFGAAAFREEDKLWNGVTWFESDFGDWKEHVAKEVVTICPPQALPLSPEPLKEERVACLVLRCSTKSPALGAVREWLASTGRYLYAWADAKWCYWLVTLGAMKPLGAHVLARAKGMPGKQRAAAEKQAYVLDHELDPVFQSMIGKKGRTK